MNATYLQALASFGSTIITHVGLVTDQGAELSGGGYRRKAVIWTVDAAGLMRPSSDLTFDVPEGSSVAGWRGFSSESGGTDYGGQALTVEHFSGAGQYTLLAKGTGIAHRIGA